MNSSSLLRRFALLSLTLAASGAWAGIGDSSVRSKLEAADIRFTVDRDGDFITSWTMDDGSSQRVYLNGSSSRYRDLAVREVWGIAFRSEEPLSPERLRWLLVDNSKKKIGAWQILLPKSPGDTTDVVFSITIPATADGDDLRAALNGCASSCHALSVEWGDSPSAAAVPAISSATGDFLSLSDLISGLSDASDWTIIEGGAGLRAETADVVRPDIPAALSGTSLDFEIRSYGSSSGDGNWTMIVNDGNRNNVMISIYRAKDIDVDLFQQGKMTHSEKIEIPGQANASAYAPGPWVPVSIDYQDDCIRVSVNGQSFRLPAPKGGVSPVSALYFHAEGRDAAVRNFRFRGAAAPAAPASGGRSLPAAFLMDGHSEWREIANGAGFRPVEKADSGYTVNLSPEYTHAEFEIRSYGVLDDDEPGNWTMIVGSESQNNVMISVYRDKDVDVDLFQQGKMTHSEKVEIPGQANASASAPGPWVPVSVDFFDNRILVSVNGRLFRLPSPKDVSGTPRIDSFFFRSGGRDVAIRNVRIGNSSGAFAASAASSAPAGRAGSGTATRLSAADLLSDDPEGWRPVKGGRGIRSGNGESFTFPLSAVGSDGAQISFTVQYNGLVPGEDDGNWTLIAGGVMISFYRDHAVDVDLFNENQELFFGTKVSIPGQRSATASSPGPEVPVTIDYGNGTVRSITVNGTPVDLPDDLPAFETLDHLWFEAEGRDASVFDIVVTPNDPAR